MPTVADNLRLVRQRIERAASSAGRDPSQIRLLAVSKTVPADKIREAYDAGQRDFGENYVQELATKARALADLPDLNWHVIGHVQRNKAQRVAELAHTVHSLDSSRLAVELGRRAAALGRRLPVLIEVNVGGERQKTGVDPAELEELVRATRAERSLLLVGLMTVPPHTEDPAASLSYFERLSELRERHGGAAALPELSMGMSHDLEWAVQAGATIVRVGTAIFGARA